MSSIKSIKDKNGKTTNYKVNNKSNGLKTTIKEVRNGKYDGYHVRKLNGKEFIAANPDKKSKNNVNE